MAEAAAVIEHVTSSDGTRIAYHRSGEGPSLVLVHGTTGAHWSWHFATMTAPELVADEVARFLTA